MKKDIEDLFVKKHIAEMAKDKGFNEPCFTLFYESGKLRQSLDYNLHNAVDFNTRINAPLYQQVVDWLETKGKFISVFEEFGQWILCMHHYDEDGSKVEIWKHKGPYANKYAAYDKAFEELLTLVKGEDVSSIGTGKLIEVGKKYLTKTNAVYQGNQQSLNNRIVVIDEIKSSDEIICRVDFDDENSVYLPFDETELLEIT